MLLPSLHSESTGTRTLTHTQAHPYPHTHTHSHIYTHTHSHTHTYTHIHAHRPSHPHSLLNTQPEHPGAAQPPWLCRTRLEQVICSMVQNCPTYSVPAKVKSRAKEIVQTGKTYRTEQDPLTHIPGQWGPAVGCFSISP